MKTKAKYLKFTILIVSLCILLGAISACLPFSKVIPIKLNENAVDDTAAEISHDWTSDSLGVFPDGYSYVYTDKDRVDDFREGKNNSDLNTHVVAKTSDNRGTQDNPYVIETTADWENFVKFCGINLSNSTGKYFVLAKDLNFQGKDFYPVARFGGTFYGMGHKFLNINCSTWKCYDGSGFVEVSTTLDKNDGGFGIFCSATGAVITDFINENYTFSKFPVITTGPTINGYTNYAPFVGGIVGLSKGNNTFLNCQTSGTVTTTDTYKLYFVAAGIAAMHTVSGSGRTFYAYRCSTKFSVTAGVTNYGVMTGGIIGDNYASETILDCVSNMYANVKNGGYAYTSSIFGWADITTDGADKYIINNCIGKIDSQTSCSCPGAALGVIRGADNSFDIQNTYAEGTVGTSSKKSLRAVMNANAQSSKGTYANINVVKSSTGYYDIPSGRYDALEKISGQPKEHTSSSVLKSKAVEFFGAEKYSKIWDTSKIGSDYTPDNSPVRNYLIAYVNFRNIINGGKNIATDVETVGIADGIEYVIGETLPTNDNTDTKVNKDFSDWISDNKSEHQVFKGWTDVPTGEKKPFKVLPEGLVGNVTLYAVWGLEDNYVNSQITATLTTNKVDEDPTKNNVITYDGVESIELTANVTHKAIEGGMTLPTVEYYWTQTVEGETAADSETINRDDIISKKYIAEIVADSGLYSYTYRITDKDEPLWYYDGELDSDKSQKITIKKGVLSIDTVTFKSRPYVGKALVNLEFTATAKNSAGTSVPLKDTTFWKVTASSIKIGEGSNTFAISLRPEDTANYNDPDNVDYTFDSETLYLTFAFPELAEELKAEIEYNNNYGPNEIIYEFNQVYVDALANKIEFSGLEGLSPYLADKDDVGEDPTHPKSKGSPIVRDSSGKEPFGKSYKPTEPLTIYVYLEETEYTVTFDPDSDKNTVTMPDPKGYGYGKFVNQPNDPTNGELLFLGWYFDTKDENGDPIRRAWRFYSKTVTDEDGNTITLPQDRVTGNLTLKAEWLSASNLDEVTFEVNPTATFTALETIDNGDYLTVTAKYSGTKDGNTAHSDKVVSYGKYTIEYGRKIVGEDGEETYVYDCDTLKVVEGGMYVRVGVLFNTEYVYSEPKQIPVNPIDISDVTDKFNFGDKNGTVLFEYDGKGHTLPEFSKIDIATLTDGQIEEIEYVYKNIKNEVVAEPTDIGTYTVTVTYKTASGDYYAKPTSLTLKIRSSIKVKVEWESARLMYTGSAQYPKISKVYNAETGAEVIISESMIDYSGDLDATKINIGDHYTVSVFLGESYSVVEGEECEFVIVKALLEIPTYTSGSILYDGNTKVLEEQLGSAFNPLLMEIVSGGTGRDVDTYRATIKLKDTINCSWADNTITSKQIEWKIEPAILYVSWDKWEFVDDGSSAYAPKISNLAGLVGTDSFDYDANFIYKIYDENDELLNVSEVSDIGSYKIVANFNGTFKNYVLDATSKEWYFVVVPKSGMTVITIEWNETKFMYDGEIHYPTPTIKDSSGKDITEEFMPNLKFSDGYYKRRDIGTYKVSVTLKGSVADEYFIRSGATCIYKITDKNGNAPGIDDTDLEPNSGNDGNGSGGVDFDKILKTLKEYWQAIVSGVCIVLIVAFLGKAASYEGRRKRANKTADERYKSAYAAGAVGLFGLASSTWTIIAMVFLALTVASFVIMLICKGRCRKAEDGLAFAREDFERNQADVEARRREENMRMMLMSMMGGQGGNMGQGMGQGGFAYQQQGIGIEDIRGIVSETMTAMLPGVQQMLPQQASTNDELVQKLIDQNEKLMRELAEQKTSEKIIEREVAATSSLSDEALKSLIEGQRIIMEKLANQPNEPQVVEKVIEKEVPIEKIVEKIVEVPVEVEKIVEKEVKIEVPVEVEKVVEKEVIKEVPVEVEKIIEVEVPVEKIVEVPVEVEKIVEKEVIKEVKVAAPAKPKKEVAPKLTLDEAYALLSKEQKKYFDGLRDYAMNKYKCKEKKSTYFVTYGQTTTNPLLKLTIKKDTTVALYKMEDEYLKDIKRDASGEGTKIKVKETELVVSDAQAFETAKNMVDLREDQIERYNDLLKEQRSVRTKK